MALRAPIPSGTVTLLFTDIEGSTQHWEEQSAAMSDALRRHDELLRAAIEAHDGYVFKTMGDGFCAAFSRAADAVAAGIDAQRALATEDWGTVGGVSVRMALHSGATQERDGDYFGPAVNRVARILAIVHGGQIVLSETTALLLRGVMPDQTDLRDLGEHRLKDLAKPEHVWQLVAPDLPDTSRPLTSLASLPNNLPRQVTPLIGRDEVLAEIKPLVLEHPLLTLVGTGGVGKTRLALQTGADLLDGSSDGVWFVELAPLRDGAPVVNVIASTFGLREEENRSLLDVLMQYLHSRRLLLILDNCEHLIEEVARVADAILRSAPHVRIVATSREPLRITAEHVYRVPSLTIPSGDSLTSEEAPHYGAIALFVERARAADAKFALTDESAPIVGEICRRLDGIALAIELAAARVKVMAPRQLAQKLDERFRVLTGGSRTAMPRQQTMRALIEWSYDLLSDQEQRLFRRLAIFVGGWTLEAAQAVCIDETLDALDADDLLSSLVEKSLVVADLERSHARYRFLESTRAFAREKLEPNGERETLERRHAQWAADFADRAREAWWSAPTSRWLYEFAPELENARSAIGWALEHDEVILAARCVVGFSGLYRRLEHAAQFRSWLEPVLERLDDAAEPALVAGAWEALSSVTVGSRKMETARRAVELGEQSNDAAITTLSLTSLAFGLVQAGRAGEAQDIIDRAVQRATESGLTRSSFFVDALDVKAFVARNCGRFDEARHLFPRALSLAVSSEYEDQATWVRLNMAELEFQMGNTAHALELVRAIDTSGRPASRYVMMALLNGAAYQIALGGLEGARDDAREALRLSRGTAAQRTTIAIQHLATISALDGNARSGARLRGYADAWYRSEEMTREPTEQRTDELLVTALREQLSDAEFDALAAEGSLISEDQAVAEALAVSV
jgi:predicted ATPase/class 3 adenylate cyclase